MIMELHRLCLPSLLALVLVGCQGTRSGADQAEGAGESSAAAPSGAVSLPFLLSMDYEEASAISAQKTIVPPLAKIAADSIEVLRKQPNGDSRRVRAKGHVFVQLDYELPARALCQEALIGEKELILRGKPVLQRGASTVEGTSDVTVFYLNSERLRVIGPHKVTSVRDMIRSGQSLGAWSGANPLLPPLDAGVVPDAVRDELQKSIEAEMALQQSRIGVAPAFPLGDQAPLSKPVALPEDTSPALPKKEAEARKPEPRKESKP